MLKHNSKLNNRGAEMKTFADLEFKEMRTNHFQAKRQFGKYNLSVILEPRKTLYEAAIFEGDNFVQLPGINYDDDVISGLMPDDVTSIMKKLKTIEVTSKLKL